MDTTTKTNPTLRVNTIELTVDATDLAFGDYLPGVGVVTKNDGPTGDLGVSIETIAYDVELDRSVYTGDFYTGPQTIVRQTMDRAGWSVPTEFVGDLETALANGRTHCYGPESRCYDCDCRPWGAFASWPCGMELPRLG